MPRKPARPLEEVFEVVVTCVEGGRRLRRHLIAPRPLDLAKVAAALRAVRRDHALVVDLDRFVALVPPTPGQVAAHAPLTWLVEVQCLPAVRLPRHRPSGRGPVVDPARLPETPAARG